MLRVPTQSISNKKSKEKKDFLSKEDEIFWNSILDTTNSLDREKSSSFILIARNNRMPKGKCFVRFAINKKETNENAFLLNAFLATLVKELNVSVTVKNRKTKKILTKM